MEATDEPGRDSLKVTPNGSHERDDTSQETLEWEVLDSSARLRVSSTRDLAFGLHCPVEKTHLSSTGLAVDDVANLVDPESTAPVLNRSRCKGQPSQVCLLYDDAFYERPLSLLDFEKDECSFFAPANTWEEEASETPWLDDFGSAPFNDCLGYQ